MKNATKVMRRMQSMRLRIFLSNASMKASSAMKRTCQLMTLNTESIARRRKARYIAVLCLSMRLTFLVSFSTSPRFHRKSLNEINMRRADATEYGRMVLKKSPALTPKNEQI